MESIKKLRASLQLAEMRFKSQSSESNLAIYQLAKSAYDDAMAVISNHPLAPEPILTESELKVGAELVKELHKQGKLMGAGDAISKVFELLGKTKVEKIEPVSGENQNSDLPEDTIKDGDASGTSEPTETVGKTAELEAENKAVDPIAENVEPISEPATEEKKTVDSQEPQS